MIDTGECRPVQGPHLGLWADLLAREHDSGILVVATGHSPPWVRPCARRLEDLDDAGVDRVLVAALVEHLARRTQCPV